MGQEDNLKGRAVLENSAKSRPCILNPMHSTPHGYIFKVKKNTQQHHNDQCNRNLEIIFTLSRDFPLLQTVY